MRRSLLLLALVGCTLSHAATTRMAYRPKVLTAHEFSTMTVFAETILRLNDMRGASDAKVNEFIDFQLTHDPDMQARFREGLRWVNAHARRLFGSYFVNLTQLQQAEIVARLDIKALHRPGEESGREFFELARRYTYMGYYASETALRKYVAPRPLPRGPSVANK